MGSNPTQGMDVCVCVYSVFLLFCVQVEALRRADPPPKESYRYNLKIKYGNGNRKKYMLEQIN
jgi:hypothetical protein